MATTGVGAAADSAGIVAMASGSLMDMCIVWKPNEGGGVKTLLDHRRSNMVVA